MTADELPGGSLSGRRPLPLVAIGFVYRFLPETKGLSVEQAVHVFEHAAGHSNATSSHLTEPPDVRPSQA
jgi:hypothetical protein